jgi:hypothetical protein
MSLRHHMGRAPEVSAGEALRLSSVTGSLPGAAVVL